MATMHIFVWTLSGKTIIQDGARASEEKTITLDVATSDTILTVKAKIQEKEDIAPNQQLLSFRMMTLANDDTLADYNIVDGSMLSLDKEWSLSIIVQTFDRQTFTLEEVLPVDRIVAIKVMIRYEAGIPLHQQILTAEPGVLEDDHTLGDYNIRNGDTVHVLLRQHDQ